MGALLQLNADSIMGQNGFGIKRFCHKLLKARQILFIASDAHDVKHRPPRLRECFLHVYKKYGKEYAAQLFYENAQAVIENRIIE
jgi:protein-tyrosine phosphatase